MQLKNITSTDQSFHFAGAGYTLAPGGSVDLPGHVAIDLASSFPDRFMVIADAVSTTHETGSQQTPSLKPRKKER